MDAIFVHTIDKHSGLCTQIVKANEMASTMLGYSKDELLTMTLADLDASPEFNPTLDDDFMGKKVVRFERTLLTKRGHAFPVEISAYLLELDDMTFCITIARDISERKQNEEERLLNEHRFKILYQLSQMIDEPEQDILDFALEESVRMTKSTIGYIFFMNRDETELTLNAMSHAATRQCAIKDPATVYKAEETGLWGESVRKRKAVITNDYPNHPDKRGQPAGHITIHRHMSLPIINNGRIVIVAGVGNKKEEYTESDILQLSLLLEGTWNIIQRKRMEKDLIRAKQAAEKANEVKSQFLANMSHELRTPLNGIMGMTQILLATEVSPDQEEYLDLSMEASRHLTKVVTDLLALSSIESGEIALTQIDFNLHSTLEVLTKPLALQAASKSLTMSFDIAPNIPCDAYGDAGKLRQVLINLLFNAIKFTDAGEVTLEVTINKPPSEPGGITELQFSVTDSGIGIPIEQQQSIFESFTLGEDYMTKQYGGTGLGLSISRHLAEIMGGTVNVRSTQGHGSTFTFTVPLIFRDTIKTTCDPKKLNSLESFGSLNILLAEDEQINSIMASRLLRKVGHSVSIVGNGQQAIEELAKNRFDLVLMDVQMPVVNGLQATEIIRSGAVENVAKDLPIIGLTAFAHSSEKKQFIKAGMQHIVTKPYEAEELMQAIASTMNDTY